MNIVKSLYAFLFVIAALPASALEVGTSSFKFLSDLAIAGYEPFAVNATAKASFGMKRGENMYLCFIADTDRNANIRKNVLYLALGDNNASREQPNIPVVCVLAQ
ncbi:hypothetical protein [Polycladidibacter hongkongensis]|uniref:hypothetical protein n=1 Tax=Polycladidibacter hongkongensis TaxID=1647556 RepID=UPI00083086B4|nr:hypothetical protein [Pseudovibrio hongkongensis]